MKKTLLFSALLSSMLLAGDKLYELSPMVGYNVTEGNVGLKSNGHYFGGVEFQFNTPDSKIAPEFSIYYSPKAKYAGTNPNPKDTAITRGAFNGVYTFDNDGVLVPFAKAGVGLEGVQDDTLSNGDGFFVDAGAGAKYFFTDTVAFKAEAIYLAKLSGIQNHHIDNNFMVLAGLTFAFGEAAQKEPEPVQQAVVAAPVESDDDNDGVLNSQDQCPNSLAGAKVDEKGCELDTDGDGVVDSQDKCANTQAGIKVDANGCELDSDNDGVLDSQDICPNTPAGAEVNVDGCPKTVALAINFENNSAEIQAISNAKLDKYAEFLKTYANYSALIVGYTDSRGSASYNQKLSEKRAQAVVDALISRGVNPAQLKAKGMGEANPVADNATAEGRAQNRRIEAELTRH